MRLPSPSRYYLQIAGVVLTLGSDSLAFIPSRPTTTKLSLGERRIQSVVALQHNDQQTDCNVAEQRLAGYDPACAMQFKVLTCSATSCSAKRSSLGLDEYSTFSAFFERIEDRIPEMRVEETSCLGSCKKAPCVAIEHDEYEGTVALEGMDSFEFSDRVFHRVIDEGDADRVWACVENAVQVMSEGGGEDTDANEE